MVGVDVALPLPWLVEPLLRALRSQRAHALLLHGPQGVGQFELGLSLAQAWLCETESGPTQELRPCGTCASCRLMQARAHPDLLVLLPEALSESLGWTVVDSEAEQGASNKSGKVKPSKEIKVDAVRAAVAFAQTSSARGYGKVIIVHPAERMNAIAANALLKTLEEPPGDSRFLLCCANPDALPPTIRSRCQSVPLRLPPSKQANDWLARQGIAQPEVMLAAAGGQPQLALEWAREGIDAAAWSRFPKMIARGDATGFSAWPLPRQLDALQKLCHDTLCIAAGAAPRYFPLTAVEQGGNFESLSLWAVQLSRLARHAEHPWNIGLMSEALVHQACRAMTANYISRPT